jgi:hypothetical protein
MDIACSAAAAAAPRLVFVDIRITFGGQGGGGQASGTQVAKVRRELHGGGQWRIITHVPLSGEWVTSAL